MRHVGPTTGMAASLAAVLFAAPVAGEPLRGKDRRACVGAYEQGQELAQAAKLLRAREVMLGCAQSKCGTFLHRECAARYNALEAEIPTVILLAKGASGESLVDVEVTLDGELFSATLDGRALPVDPGLHQFSFKAKRGSVAEQRTMIVQGERNRVISVSFGPKEGDRRKLPESAALRAIDEDVYLDSPGAARRGALPYVLGGLGIAGIGGFALFTYWGRMDNAELAQCAPNCTDASVNHIRNMYLVADVSLGAGVAALGAAAWLYFWQGPAKNPSISKPPRFDVQPSRGGIVASVSGEF